MENVCTINEKLLVKVTYHFYLKKKKGRNRTEVNMVSKSTRAHTGHVSWVISAFTTPKEQT